MSESTQNTNLDISLEREKLQLERERLALERERLETERESYRHTVDLSNKAAGKITMPVTTFALLLVVAVLVGGITGSKITPSGQRDNSEIAASIAKAIGQTNSTNEFDSSASPLIRALNRSGNKGGYLLILD